MPIGGGSVNSSCLPTRRTSWIASIWNLLISFKKLYSSCVCINSSPVCRDSLECLRWQHPDPFRNWMCIKLRRLHSCHQMAWHLTRTRKTYLRRHTSRWRVHSKRRRSTQMYSLTSRQNPDRPPLYLSPSRPDPDQHPRSHSLVSIQCLHVVSWYVNL